MKCPLPIIDESVNIENHRSTIANALLGPADPSLPNTAYWRNLARRWEVGEADARSRRCFNCEHYIDTDAVKECIQRHGALDITKLGPEFKNMGDASGYCTLYDITCTASRVCVDWEAGGPITTTKEGSEAMEERDDAKKMTSQQKKIRKVMREFKAGTLKGSDKKPITNRKQAIAIALSEAGLSRQGKSDQYWDAYIDTMCGSMSKGGMGMEMEEEEEENMDEGAAEARCKGYLSSLKKGKKA